MRRGDETAMIRRIAYWVALAAWLPVLGACTEETPWAGQGSEGFSCFSDYTCNPGLECRTDVFMCVKKGAADAGPDVPPMPDVLKHPDFACPTPPSPPSLSPYPTSTLHKKVALRGTAKGAAKVGIVGGYISPLTVPVKKNAFCSEIPLSDTSTAQTLYLVAIDKKGCQSKPTIAQVTYKPGSTLNLLIKKPASYKETPINGRASWLTDGLVDNMVRFSAPTTMWYCDNKAYSYLWFDMGEVHTVNKVIIKYPKKSNSKYHLMCWRILSSQKASPQPPRGDKFMPDWTSVYAKGNQKADQPKIEFSSPIKSRHLAIILYEDGEFYGNPEFFDFTEIEAWGVPRPPSCK